MSNEFVDRIRRRVHLDKDNGWVFGVCAGVANYVRLDPAFMRVGVLVTGLFFPKIVIATYLVMWMILDERPLLKKDRV
jgi:phage shock protein PspC (stress-responsive transcriptional regulator)